MAPLITPGSEFDLMWAFFIGIGFGFVLEAAGFSTSRKIVGLFYGYDFTVIKVFFTAAVTAALSLLILNHFGMVDFGTIYVPTTFIWPTVVGGVFMGLGFLIGGFCPGTSVCAAAIGKLDALAFMGGIFLGIFFYTLTYESLWMDFRNTSNIGIVTMSDIMGVSYGVSILIFAIIAIASFILVGKIKERFDDVEY